MQADSSLYESGSELMIYFELINQSELRLYTGSNLTSLGLVIEQNQTAVVGAPYRVPVAD